MLCAGMFKSASCQTPVPHLTEHIELVYAMASLQANILCGTCLCPTFDALNGMVVSLLFRCCKRHAVTL